MLVRLTTLCLLGAAPWAHAQEAAAAVEYGADISFPMAHDTVSANYPWLPHNMDSSVQTPEEYREMPLQPLGDKQTFYEETIEGCVDYYGSKGERCLSNERDRIAMTLRQPQSMVNYTKMGFTKIRAPEKVFQLIKEFWDANQNTTTDENWPAGNTYTNHWESPTYMVSVENAALKGGGAVLKQHIWNAARDTISEWTGQQLAECSLYGIRVYTEGAVLAPHVDRLPLVSSAIINVDQDVDEPWPLEVIGHDGKAHNVTMLPGDLVLYESHSIIHGRPFPLKGRFMANVFVHFEPIGPVGGEIMYGNSALPPYLIPGSPDEATWRSRNPNGHSIMQRQTFETGSTEAHRLAREGRLTELETVVSVDADVIHKKDANGWTPLHEAIRSQDVEVVKFLVDKGADINARTGKTGTGESALWWAMKDLGEDHPIVDMFKSLGAKLVGPEL